MCVDYWKRLHLVPSISSLYQYHEKYIYIFNERCSINIGNMIKEGTLEKWVSKRGRSHTSYERNHSPFSIWGEYSLNEWVMPITCCQTWVSSCFFTTGLPIIIPVWLPIFIPVSNFLGMFTIGKIQQRRRKGSKFDYIYERTTCTKYRYLLFSCANESKL